MAICLSNKVCVNRVKMPISPLLVVLVGPQKPMMRQTMGRHASQPLGFSGGREALPVQQSKVAEKNAKRRLGRAEG